MSAILSFIPTLFGIFGELPKVLAAFTFLHAAIMTVETKAMSGPDKLTAVLNEFETFLQSAAPQWSGEFSTIAAELEAVVNEIVGLFNGFKNAAPAA